MDNKKPTKKIPPPPPHRRLQPTADIDQDNSTPRPTSPVFLDDKSKELPIIEYKVEIMRNITQSDSCVVIGETGSGKTTELPGMILEILGEQGKLAVTQPRKIAAKSVAKRVASMRGQRLGQEIGYQIRHESEASEETRATFMTEGILILG